MGTDGMDRCLAPYLLTKPLAFLPLRSQPLRGIVDVKFNQPIFGANNLQGKVMPVSCLGAASPVDWKARFLAGGTDVLIPSLLRLMDQLHQEGSGAAAMAQRQQQQHQQQQFWGSGGGGIGGGGGLPVAQAVGVGAGAEGGGYMDPNDPSRVLVNAPMVSAEEAREEGKEVCRGKDSVEGRVKACIYLQIYDGRFSSSSSYRLPSVSASTLLSLFSFSLSFPLPLTGDSLVCRPYEPSLGPALRRLRQLLKMKE